MRLVQSKESCFARFGWTHPIDSRMCIEGIRTLKCAIPVINDPAKLAPTADPPILPCLAFRHDGSK